MAAHHAALVRGDPGYADPETGLTVLTAAFLRGRAECCDTGCRHCPYLPTDLTPERAADEPAGQE